jgi:AraC-like DNA-binding protein
MAYRELLQPGEHVACVWVRDPEPHARTQRVLPDACVDVVLVGDRLVVAGPQTTAAVVAVPAGTPSIGVRFRVGAAGAALGIPAAELLDLTVEAEELWGGELAERVATSSTPLHELAAAVAERLSDAPDPLVRAAATGTPRHALGIGDRQLRRRFAEAVGYGPKTLERILRFQRFLALAAGRDRDLARLALEAGYADQAHLTRECSRLAGLPPAALLASGAGPAGERSVSFNTPSTGPASMAA